MKKILAALLFLVLGGLIAMGWFFQKNHSVITPLVVETDQVNKVESTKFSLEEAPIDSIKGEILNLIDVVSWQSRIATEPGKLDKEILIQQGEKLVTNETGNAVVKFGSSGIMTIFPNSEVEISQTLPINLVFNQLKGLGQYQVTGVSLVSVRCFNLLVNVSNGLITVQADEETGEVMLGLKSGQATVAYNSPEFVSKVWELESGDKFVFDNNERKGYFKADL